MTFLSLSLRRVLILHCEYEVQSVQVRVGYRRHSVLWFYRDLPPLYTYANFPIHFNVMPFLTVFGQSQSSILTIGCEWIRWIPGVQWPQSKQTGRRGPCFSADDPCSGRCPLYCFDWEWRGGNMEEKYVHLTVDRDVASHFLLWSQCCDL